MSDFTADKDLSELEQDTIHKVLEVSGAENPPQFLQILINSPVITDYPECKVQQQRARYGMIELTIYAADNKKILTLYNPN